MRQNEGFAQIHQTMKEWLKSVLDYRSYPKNKTGYPFLDHP